MEEYGILKSIKVKVKKNENTGNTSYRTVFTNKAQSGDTEFASMFIRFVKDAANKKPEKDCYIKIKKGFISFNKDQFDNTNWVLVISDFDTDDSKDEKYEEFTELPF